MIYWRCQCGKAELWESGMSPRSCQGCTDCNTTYATSASGHLPIEPHEWEPRYSERTGQPDGMICRRCHKSAKDMEHPKPAVIDCTRVHKRKLDL